MVDCYEIKIICILGIQVISKTRSVGIQVDMASTLNSFDVRIQYNLSMSLVNTCAKFEAASDLSSEISTSIADESSSSEYWPVDENTNER